MNQALIPAAKPIVGDDERAAVDAVLASGMLAQGPEVAAFEQEFSAALVDSRECVAVNSGTSGLHLGLLAAGIGRGDEVIVPSFTFAATANAVALTGATPVFADIDPVTFCLDATSAATVITDKTKAIMPVHLYGHPADMDAMSTLAKEHDLQIFEDAAQAHGATWHGAPVGSFGTFAMFSLYPTKNMTSGEGGMVSASTPEVVRALRLLRNQGMLQQYANEVIGFNARMTDVHAAIGRVQLRKLPEWTKQRQANADFLTQNLSGVSTPEIVDGASHVFHQYTIRVAGGADERDRFAAALREEFQVGCGVYYPTPCHKLSSLKHLDSRADLPKTEQAAAEVLSLPVHPSLTQGDLERIVTAVNTLSGSAK
ncbi:MAG TPA: DegT/DnrJ/EryC1/StrS family aminotransferase [Marmoricola sp.]|nr:DegT/DnrJ/EryC1/StrS family aminotransferase [Nocardioidaceae bacterium]MCB8992635.1 DegT/DnrJ/EryC1/StrS family aminotransferase [Nocardioidaceae bacterium]HRV69114.1 DegT/DnrJ/EryC1/StrS family aminotransferase [Marmoricola sp.]